MFTMPKLGGHEQFKRLVQDFGGRQLAARDFRLGLDLVDRYCSGEVDVPLATMLAVYWQGPYGFDHGFRESSWTHNYNSWLKNEARDRVELLEAYIVGQGLPLPPGRLTTHREMLAAGPEPLAGALSSSSARNSAMVSGDGAAPHVGRSSRDVPVLPDESLPPRREYFDLAPYGSPAAL